MVWQNRFDIMMGGFEIIWGLIREKQDGTD